MLIKMTPAEIKGDARRLRRLFGSNHVVSPGHDAILPNAPFENIVAMAGAAREEEIRLALAIDSCHPE